ncbi:MAG: ABC transporter ATP-binding protein [Flavobacteriaceae bacterium]|nr:ABC transporter ATP-binding protein [Flavobacteriaceae bacterium]
MLRVERISFSYEAEKSVLKDISFDVLPGERLCILGESGSGKSTLLKLINAELQPDSGQIFFNKSSIRGRDYQLIPGHDRIRYVSQEFELDSFIPVHEIVGKFLSNMDLPAKNKRINTVLEALNLLELANQKAENLSGGQKQRVAIARAIASPPDLLLLDEPFGQLDAALHIQIRDQLFNFLEKNKISVIFSSHRSDDALGYSDKVILLREGKILQIDSPQRIYHQPYNTYVAKLFGQLNILGPDLASKLGIQRNFLKDVVVIYPEEIRIDKYGTHTGLIKKNRFIGNGFEIEIIYKGKRLRCRHPENIMPDTKVQFSILKYRWVKSGS